MMGLNQGLGGREVTVGAAWQSVAHGSADELEDIGLTPDSVLPIIHPQPCPTVSPAHLCVSTSFVPGLESFSWGTQDKRQPCRGVGTGVRVHPQSVVGTEKMQPSNSREQITTELEA